MGKWQMWRRWRGSLQGAHGAWEYRLILVRSVLVIAALGGIYALIGSRYHRYAGLAFWLLFIAVVVSVIYQQVRRRRESNV